MIYNRITVKSTKNIDLEMDPQNLVTLCRSKNRGFNCHLAVGHGGNCSWYKPYLIAQRSCNQKWQCFVIPLSPSPFPLR